jgi:hypothetical protein
MCPCGRVVSRQQSDSDGICTLDTSNQYLVWFQNFRAIPPDLRRYVRQRILTAFSRIRSLVFDFDGLLSPRDVRLEYTNYVPILSAWGENLREEYETSGERGPALCEVHLEMMRQYRIQASGDDCEPAFESTILSLGAKIANTTVHELGHALGIESGGWDDSGHVSDEDNYMYMFRPTRERPARNTRVNNGYFEYTVRSGDNMPIIIRRFKQRRLHQCIRGADNLTIEMVWEDSYNQAHGFVAHPTKSDVPGRRAGNPRWIYPGERVALIQHTFRIARYRRIADVGLGDKRFSAEQVQTMNDFVQNRIRTLSGASGES